MIYNCSLKTTALLKKSSTDSWEPGEDFGVSRILPLCNFHLQRTLANES